VKLLSWFTLALVTVFCLGPVAWQGVTSIKTDADLVRLPPLLPDVPTWQHYANVARSALSHDVMNSVVVAVATTALAVSIGALCAFGLVRLPLRGKGVLLTLMLALSMFPPIAVVSPLYLLARAMGLRDTLTVLVLVHTTYALPLAVWILTNFLKHVPVELYWAARVDGCTPLRAFWSVLLPPARPGVAVAALLVFIFSWNEFLFALTLTATDRARTAPVAIALFPGLHEVPWGDMAAATLTVTAPVVLLTVIFQRYIVAGLTAGSVKG
jgi:multiple sugar transport system permease protein